VTKDKKEVKEEQRQGAQTCLFLYIGLVCVVMFVLESRGGTGSGGVLKVGVHRWLSLNHQDLAVVSPILLVVDTVEDVCIDPTVNRHRLAIFTPAFVAQFARFAVLGRLRRCTDSPPKGPQNYLKNFLIPFPSFLICHWTLFS
jgi:hypothetical protein